MKKWSITLTLASFFFLSFAADAADGNREAILKKIKRACEKNIERPKILGERILFCACVVRNHGLATKTDELSVIERIYSKAVSSHEKTTTTESVVADFDIDVAEACLKDAKFQVSKF
jgi:hypothetical protein